MRELPKICNRIKQDLYNLYKYVQDNVYKLIASLEDYRLNNKFTGNLVQGYYNPSTGVYDSSYKYAVCDKTKYTCVAGDIISLKAEGSVNGVFIVWYNGSSYLSYTAISSKELVATAPANATAFTINFQDSSQITPDNVSHVGLYINNEIDEVKVNLIKTQTVRNSVTVGPNSSTSFNVLVDDIGTTIDKVISFNAFPNYDGSSSNLRLHVTRFNTGFNVQVYNTSNNEVSNNIASVVTFLGL